MIQQPRPVPMDLENAISDAHHTQLPIGTTFRTFSNTVRLWVSCQRGLVSILWVALRALYSGCLWLILDEARKVQCVI